jgi:hypothetical protein
LYIGETTTTVSTVERVTQSVIESAMLAQRVALETGQAAARIHAFAWCCTFFLFLMILHTWHTFQHGYVSTD